MCANPFTNKSELEIAMMVHTNRYVSLILVIVFIFCTTHLIFHEPVYSSNSKSSQDGIVVNYKQRAFREHALQGRTAADDAFHININAGKVNSTNYVIFDASQHAGRLDFLDVKIDGWHLLVINLKNLSQLTTCKHCLSLTDEWIKSNIVDKLLSNSRNLDIDSNGLAKLAAYAYVLSQGATWIYTTDKPVAIPYRALLRVAKHEVRTGLVYQGPQTIFEPCNHFMDPYTWRGRGSQKVQGRYNVKVVSSHSIHQVVNECFIKGINQEMWLNSLDTKAPLPYIMPGVFTTIDLKNVLVSNQTAWALIASLLPYSDDSLTTSPRAVILNLLVQRVLWDTKGNIGFLPDKNNAGHKCPNCEIGCAIDKVGKDFLKNLTQWRCDFFETVPTCLLRLTSANFVSDKGFQDLTSLWITLLNKYGWVSIERRTFSEDRLVERFIGIPVYFNPAKSLHRSPRNDTRPPNYFRELCKEKGKPYHSKIPDQHVFNDIILIVVFNFRHLVSQIPLLDYVYGRHFKYIVYCSESSTEFESRYLQHFNNSPVTFIEIHHMKGYWAQSCMTATIKMGYDVSGYIQVSDDVLLNVWNLKNLPFNKPWFQSSIRVANISRPVVPDVWINKYWWPWMQFFGKTAAINAFRQLEEMISNPAIGDRVLRFLENLKRITNCDRCFLYEASDIFYLPSYMSSNFTFFSDIFSYHNVFLEITIPTILVGLTKDSDVYRLRGTYLWFHDRERYQYVYTEYDHFYHAMKVSTLIKKTNLKFYCNHFLAKIDNDVMRLRDDY